MNKKSVATRAAVWAALIAVGGWLSIPIPLVPITLQTFFVVLAGLIEGPLIGALSALLYLLVGLAGAPVFSGGVGGLAFLARPSAGFALAFPLGGALAGVASAARTGQYRFMRGLTMAFVAHAVILLCGVAGLVLNAGMVVSAALATLPPLLPGALVKSAGAAAVAAMGIFSRRQGFGSSKSGEQDAG